MNRRSLIRVILREGLNIPKRSDKSIDYDPDIITITYISEFIDNWGNINAIDDPVRIKEILKDSSLWSDDQTLYSNDPRTNINFTVYLWDDLVDKYVRVAGDDEVFLVIEQAN